MITDLDLKRFNEEFAKSGLSYKEFLEKKYGNDVFADKGKVVHLLDALCLEINNLASASFVKSSDAYLIYSLKYSIHSSVFQILSIFRDCEHENEILSINNSEASDI